MPRYQYQGSAPVDISLYGIVQPGQQIKVSYPILHPDFIEVKPPVQQEARKPKGK